MYNDPLLYRFIMVNGLWLINGLIMVIGLGK